MDNAFKDANPSCGAAASAAPVKAAAADSDINAAFHERFELVETLAKSDTRTLYLARDRNHPGGGPVRLQVLSKAAAADSRQVELFRLEARAASMLSHRNIIQSTEAEEVGGVHFCVTEDKPGVETLRDLLKRKGWLDTDEALRIIQQVAEALGYAHGLGALHLTLDPEKILLDRDGTAVVTDFGIEGAQHLFWAHQERSQHCAARYLSPEQARCWPVDQRADLYALGIILYEMLADRAPFDSDDPVAIKLKQMSRLPQPPHTFRPGLSKALSGIVMDLLRKRPDERPDSAAAFASALRQCIDAGLTADEEIESPNLLFEADPQGESIGYAAVDSWQAPEEHQDSTDALVVFSDGTSGFDTFEVAPPVGAAVVMDEDVQGEDFSEPEGVSLPVGRPSVEVTEAPAEKLDAYRSGESIVVGPMFMSSEHSGVKPRRLAWLMLLLLVLGGGLFWAARKELTFSAARVQDRAETDGPEPVAVAPTQDEPTAPIAPQLPSEEESLPESKPLTLTAADMPIAGREAAAPEGQAEEVPAEELPEPKRPAIAPPSFSAIEPVIPAHNDLPAGFNGKAMNNTQPAEPPPAPEQPRKAEPPAPKVIRKSGDVLQNTAIIRPRPVYPEAARKADVNGSVTVEVTVDEEGNVIAARPIAGPEPLRDAAVDAARRWKWTPARIDRERAKVVGTITFNFRE